MRMGQPFPFLIKADKWFGILVISLASYWHVVVSMLDNDMAQYL